MTKKYYISLLVGKIKENFVYEIDENTCNKLHEDITGDIKHLLFCTVDARTVLVLKTDINSHELLESDTNLAVSKKFQKVIVLQGNKFQELASDITEEEVFECMDAVINIERLINGFIRTRSIGDKIVSRIDLRKVKLIEMPSLDFFKDYEYRDQINIERNQKIAEFGSYFDKNYRNYRKKYIKSLTDDSLINNEFLFYQYLDLILKKTDRFDRLEDSVDSFDLPSEIVKILLDNQIKTLFQLIGVLICEIEINSLSPEYIGILKEKIYSIFGSRDFELKKTITTIDHVNRIIKKIRIINFDPDVLKEKLNKMPADQVQDIFKKVLGPVDYQVLNLYYGCNDEKLEFDRMEIAQKLHIYVGLVDRCLEEGGKKLKKYLK